MTDEFRESLNEVAWHDFVMFAWTQEDAHAAFRGATGKPQRPKTGSFLDVMIDRACGVTEDDKYMIEFIDWVTETQWGADCAPESWKANRRVAIRLND